MHCVHCGAEIPDYAKFCTSCGERVQAAPVEPSPVVDEEPVAAESVDEPAPEVSDIVLSDDAENAEPAEESGEVSGEQ